MDFSDISQELLKKAADGDMDAFESIYRASSGFVYNVALRVTGSREDAEEAVQEVFIKLFRNLSSFQFRSSFKTWIYRVAVNTALNLAKSSKNRASRQVVFDDAIAEKITPANDTVEKSVTEAGNRELVERMLKTLPPDYKMAITLREMQGLSYEEMAEALDLNINTVRTRLKRARELLMKEVMACELR